MDEHNGNEELVNAEHKLEARIKTFEEMCAELAVGSHKKLDPYRWGITTILAITGIILGLYVQSERYTKTVFVLDARVTALEKQFTNFEAKLDRIGENMITKDDLERLVK